MLRKIFPVLLALSGLGGGIAAGLLLRPAALPEGEGQHADGDDAAHEPTNEAEANPDETPEFVKLNNQFVVPVVDEGRVAAMVVLSLSLEVTSGSTEAVFQREPRLRDAFLQVLFDHANLGGFSGSFTDGSNLVVLRESLLEAASQVLGPMVKDILITDIARQDS